jgi:hypothetical protein
MSAISAQISLLGSDGDKPRHIVSWTADICRVSGMLYILLHVIQVERVDDNQRISMAFRISCSVVKRTPASGYLGVC